MRMLCLLLFGLSAAAANMDIAWDNSTNNVGVGIATRIYWGAAPGVYTNSIVVPLTTTNLVITNLLGGVKYYFAAVHFDATDQSPYSNELMGKTAIHPPKLIDVSKP